jgi:hypothetical protein
VHRSSDAERIETKFCGDKSGGKKYKLGCGGVWRRRFVAVVLSLELVIGFVLVRLAGTSLQSP